MLLAKKMCRRHIHLIIYEVKIPINWLRRYVGKTFILSFIR